MTLHHERHKTSVFSRKTESSFKRHIYRVFCTPSTPSLPLVKNNADLHTLEIEIQTLEIQANDRLKYGDICGRQIVVLLC